MLTSKSEHLGVKLIDYKVQYFLLRKIISFPIRTVVTMR